MCRVQIAVRELTKVVAPEEKNAIIASGSENATAVEPVLERKSDALLRVMREA